MADDEITQWLGALGQGDNAATERIWEQYFEKLVRLARTKLTAGQRRMADEEDVALSAMNSFFRGAARGRFPKLEDRQDLWRILVTITARKASHQVRRQMQQKRGSGDVRGESVFGGHVESDSHRGIGNILGSEPTPEVAALAVEECERLLSLLPDDQFRQIAAWKLEGYTNDEISEMIPCAPRTVERKLERIRKLWERSEE
ncbi:MAG: RNA polymerase subunit sigma-70 [Planctomycetaceae bacterium]|nr:hypothetical protein [Planctomycetales bacterium]MCB9922606.1 RNA polymerase subunit sigma-70 [Planctomycetaceae bacterium]